MTAITYLQTVPWRVLGWRWRRKATNHQGATADWSPAQEQAQQEPDLPDVELVKRSEDELIIHNLLNDIEAAFRTGLDAACSTGMRAICAGDPESYSKALGWAAETGQYDLAELEALLADDALPAGAGA